MGVVIKNAVAGVIRVVRRHPANLMTPNQAYIESDLAGWNAWLGASIERVTASPMQGTASMRLVCPDAENWKGVRSDPSIPLVSGKQYSFSCKAKGQGQIGITISRNNGPGIVLAGVTLLDGTVQDVSCTWIATETAGDYQFGLEQIGSAVPTDVLLDEFVVQEVA